MDTKLVEKVTKEYKKVKHPKFRVGDIVEVSSKLKEDGKERTQVFRGIVIAIKGSDTSRTFTVRKISYGIGVEKILPLYSPLVTKIKIVKQAKNVKRSKLYYLRDRVGKSALKAGTQVPAEGKNLETEFEEEEESKSKVSASDKSTSDKQKSNVKKKDSDK